MYSLLAANSPAITAGPRLKQPASLPFVRYQVVYVTRTEDIAGGNVGVTEAGSLVSGTVKSALGIGILLAEGIGDTIRVSLTRDPVDEIRVGYEILKALKIRQRGPDIISCPTCGRCDIDLVSLVERVESALLKSTTPVQLAIMGCVVNGPGEAREADIGVAGGKGHGVLFKKGKVVRKIKEKSLAETLLSEVEAYEARSKHGKRK